MGSTEPGAKLGEEDVGANSQEQGFLLNEAITTSIKKNGHKEDKCASMSG